jgi:hypothetical protein
LCCALCRWGLGPYAAKKKQLIAEGKLDKYGRPNENTPAGEGRIARGVDGVGAGRGGGGGRRAHTTPCGVVCLHADFPCLAWPALLLAKLGCWLLIHSRLTCADISLCLLPPPPAAAEYLRALPDLQQQAAAAAGTPAKPAAAAAAAAAASSDEEMADAGAANGEAASTEKKKKDKKEKKEKVGVLGVGWLFRGYRSAWLWLSAACQLSVSCAFSSIKLTVPRCVVLCCCATQKEKKDKSAKKDKVGHPGIVQPRFWSNCV